MTSNDKDAITDTPKQPQFYNREDGVSIAYHYTQGQSLNKQDQQSVASACVVFLSGFKSDMEGSKATALERFCQSRSQSFLRFDYQGHGQSSGLFEEGSIGIWSEDALSILDHIANTHNEQSFILVGSSMGGWIMLRVALARTPKIIGLIGLAAAPDFTERLMLSQLSDDQLIDLNENGQIELPSSEEDEPYIITKKLLSDGRDQCVLDAAIPLDIPVRLIHGMEDKDVPWSTAIDLSAQLTSDDVTIQLVKGAGHRLSEEPDLNRLYATLGDLLKLLESKTVVEKEERMSEAAPARVRKTGVERRMVHRLLVHWRQVVQDENKFLTLEDVLDWDIDGISDQIYVLKITHEGAAPIFESVGTAFQSELNIDLVGESLSLVPDATLLKNASSYYEKVLALKVPFTIGGDFVNSNNETILYRSIITPLRGSDEGIGMLLGAANFKVKKEET